MILTKGKIATLILFQRDKLITRGTRMGIGEGIGDSDLRNLFSLFCRKFNDAQLTDFYHYCRASVLILGSVWILRHKFRAKCNFGKKE